MNNKVFIVDSIELPTPGTHMFTIQKFSSGFRFYNYEIFVVKTLDDIEDNSIVVLSNHGIHNIHSLNYLSIKYPNCIYICWFFHEYYNTIPFKKFILTGEHFRKKPLLDSHINRWNIQQNVNNYVPLTFASYFLPEQIDQILDVYQNRKVNGCHIGNLYKYDWIKDLPNIIYLTGIHFNDEIKEDDRINIFLSSKIAFGFHHDDNLKNNVVVERVFEGMSLGCVVISDSLTAYEITGGIVQYAKDKEEFIKIYNELINDDTRRLELQKKGCEWVKSNGLYIHTVKNFLDKCKELKFID